MITKAQGRYPGFAFPGGYSIIYYFEDGEPCCAECANGLNDSDALEGSDDSQWNLVGQDIYWEGPTQHCSHCNKELKSEYGNPDDN